MRLRLDKIKQDYICDTDGFNHTLIKVLFLIAEALIKISIKMENK